MLDRIVSMQMTSQDSQVKVFLNMVFRFFGDICKYRLCPCDIIDTYSLLEWKIASLVNLVYVMTSSCGTETNDLVRLL